MENGFVQIYWGNGKGKTTAALGAAMRACGAGLKVHLVQFMKNEISGEIASLEKFPNFSFKQFGTRRWLNKNNNSANKEKSLEALNHLGSSFNEDYDLIIADEILYALQFSLLQEFQIIELIKNKPKTKELILTGSHLPYPNIFSLADLITEMKKHKHPYDSGIHARKGIEY